MSNCEIELDFSWSKECLICEKLTASEIMENSRVTATETKEQNFEENNAKLHVRVVTLYINDIINFLQNKKEGFKRAIPWKKCRSEIKT